MDTDWALGEIGSFIALTELRQAQNFSSPRLVTRGNQDEIIAAAEVVEQIFDKVLPQWRSILRETHDPRRNRWFGHRELAQRVQTKLQRQEEIDEKLGDTAPQLSAASLHPWIWDGARSLWQSGHRRQAIVAAAIKLNAEVQNKVGRRDVSETDLFRQAFTEKAPEPNRPRLRVVPDDGSKTFQSFCRGAAAFAEGCYAAIRNPASHDVQDDLPEAEALEQLAAFSVLARWVDEAKVESA